MTEIEPGPKDIKTPEPDSQDESSPQATPDMVRCPAAKDPPVRMFIVAAMCIGFGVWYYADRGGTLPSHPWTLDNLNDVLKYVINNFAPYFLLPLGLVLIGWGYKVLTRVLIADAEGIGFVGKEAIPWDQVTTLDATRIQKGFLFIDYGDGKRLTLDSWKLQNFKELVRIVEKQIPENKHVK